MPWRETKSLGPGRGKRPRIPWGDCAAETAAALFDRLLASTVI